MASNYNAGMDSVLQRMSGIGFFSRLGETLPITAGVVAVRSLAEALRTVDTDGFEWMPTTLGDSDPFHGALPHPAELADARRELNRTLMRALSALDLPALRCGAHDLQLVARDKGRPWDLGKDIEQGSVCSEIVPMPFTVIERGAIELQVNGQTRQKSDVDKLIWNIREIIEDLSRFYHLQAGDLIYTGTPEGVGAVVSGDRLEGRVEGVGSVSLTIGPAA